MVRQRPCKIVVTKHLNVYPEMQPKIGKIYDAIFSIDTFEPGSYIIPEIGKHGLLVRVDERVEVTE